MKTLDYVDINDIVEMFLERVIKDIKQETHVPNINFKFDNQHLLVKSLISLAIHMKKFLII